MYIVLFALLCILEFPTITLSGKENICSLIDSDLAIFDNRDTLVVIEIDTSHEVTFDSNDHPVTASLDNALAKNLPKGFTFCVSLWMKATSRPVMESEQKF